MCSFLVDGAVEDLWEEHVLCHWAMPSSGHICTQWTWLSSLRSTLFMVILCWLAFFCANQIHLFSVQRYLLTLLPSSNNWTLKSKNGMSEVVVDVCFLFKPLTFHKSSKNRRTNVELAGVVLFNWRNMFSAPWGLKWDSQGCNLVYYCCSRLLFIGLLIKMWSMQKKLGFFG